MEKRGTAWVGVKNDMKKVMLSCGQNIIHEME